MSDVNDREYNNLLIVNESNDAKVTLYIYLPWLPFSVTSKIIQPNEKYLHREKMMFRFKLVANFDDKREKKEFPGPLEWVTHTLIRITKSLECIEENLADYPLEKRICLRKMHLKNEIPNTSGKLNLYSILDLNMEYVRKLDKDDQKKAIKKAFNEKMKIWHPDKNFGDIEIAMLIILAKETLLNDERQARYHNEADYDKGWLSPKRFKAIFWPDCYTAEQNKAYWIRIGLIAASFGLAVGGVILTVLTAGAAAPATVVLGAIFGGGLTGAGFQSGMHAISKDSVVNGCDAKSWALKAGIGFMGGAVTGGAAVGVTAGVVGIGSAALESGAVTFGQYAGIGAASGTSGGVASSLASDAGRKFVDGEDVTWKECLGHAVIGAGIGAAAGALGGLATKEIVNRQSTAGSAALEGEVVEQTAILTGAKRVGYRVAQTLTRELTEYGTEALMEPPVQMVEERFDDSVENQHPMEHAKNVAKKVGQGVAKSLGYAACTLVPEENSKQKDRNNWRNSKGSRSYEPMTRTNERREQNSQTYDAASYVPEKVDDECHVTSEEEAQEPKKATFKYISSGAWISRIIVTFFFHGEEIEREVSGSGGIIEIPAGARQVKVRFQVRRPGWGDVMKYDRINKTWPKQVCADDGLTEPKKSRYEPHVFYYERPPLKRTFTIGGNLWWEAVMKVTDENDEETGEGID